PGRGGAPVPALFRRNGTIHAWHTHLEIWTGGTKPGQPRGDCPYRSPSIISRISIIATIGGGHKTGSTTGGWPLR
ncbi:MAG: hypothetical protein ACO331_04690, partial [Prochlorothrix sp.]